MSCDTVWTTPTAPGSTPTSYDRLLIFTLNSKLLNCLNTKSVDKKILCYRHIGSVCELQLRCLKRWILIIRGQKCKLKPAMVFIWSSYQEVQETLTWLWWFCKIVSQWNGLINPILPGRFSLVGLQKIKRREKPYLVF